MSAPLLVPKGNDRSWTRAYYYAVNKVCRRMWWQQNCDTKISQAIADLLCYGCGIFRIRL